MITDMKEREIDGRNILHLMEQEELCPERKQKMSLVWISTKKKWKGVMKMDGQVLKNFWPISQRHSTQDRQRKSF